LPGKKSKCCCPEPGGYLTVFPVDTDAIMKKFDKKVVRKSIPIPRWLNRFVEEEHINVSHVLRDRLLAIYQKENSLKI
jgi:hypothetical protein